MAEKKKGSKKTVDETIDGILEAIDDDKINEEVREPEREVLMKYIKSEGIKDPKVANFEDFKKILTGYIKLHEKEIMGGDKISDNIAYGRAANLLNQIFEKEGGKEGGLVAAYKKARKGEMMDVLNKLADAMEGMKVREYVTGVMGEVDPMDYDLHVKIAAAYKAKFGNLLPKKLKTVKPEMLANNWDSLIHNHAAAMEQAKQSLRQYEPEYKKAA